LRGKRVSGIRGARISRGIRGYRSQGIVCDNRDGEKNKESRKNCNLFHYFPLCLKQEAHAKPGFQVCNTKMRFQAMTEISQGNLAEITPNPIYLGDSEGLATFVNSSDELSYIILLGK
jgi:hypothetical protein